MNIVSWNVNGIRAVVRSQALFTCITMSNPDILCLQETKAQPDQVTLELPAYPYRYWNSATKKGYAGTAIFAKTLPLRVHYGIAVERHDHEGRVVTAEFADFYVVSVYVPNAKRDLSRLPERQDWDACFLAYLVSLERRKPVIFCGDFNVAHRPIDLARPKDNMGQHGFTEEERDGFGNFLEAGFIDTFRYLHADKPGHYTWWRQFGGARERNIGWRIDYILMSTVLLPRLRTASILSQVYGSDHCPVAIELNDLPA